MKQRLRNICDSPICVLSLLVSLCCIIMSELATNFYGEGNHLASTSRFIGIAILCSLTVWIIFMLTTKRKAKEMSGRLLLILRSINQILFLCMIYLQWGVLDTVIWAGVLTFDEISRRRQIAEE